MPALSIIKQQFSDFLSSALPSLKNKAQRHLGPRVLSLLIPALIFAKPGFAEAVYIPTPEELAEGQVEIVAGENRTVYEYRVNGRLLLIKVVPKLGATYYMVPADGQPHFESLDHKKKLYPQWVLIEF